MTLSRLKSLWNEADLAAEGAGEDEIRRAEEELDLRLPGDYLEFMRWRNGGEGAVGREGYLHLCRIEELTELNARYAEFDHLAQVVLFGDDRGGLACGFTRDGGVVTLPFIGGVEDAIAQGSFTRFMLRCASGTTFDRD